MTIEEERLLKYKDQIQDVHEYLGIPNGDDVCKYTPYYRIKLLEKHYLKSLSEIENYYLRKQS